MGWNSFGCHSSMIFRSRLGGKVLEGKEEDFLSGREVLQHRSVLRCRLQVDISVRLC